MAVAWSGSKLGAASADIFGARSAGGRAAAAALPGTGRSGAADGAAAQSRSARRRGGGDRVGRRAAYRVRRGAAGGDLAAGRPGAAFHDAAAPPARGAASSGWTWSGPAASTCSARRPSPSVRRAGRRRWWPAASWRRGPRCSWRRRSTSSWPGSWKASATFGGPVRYDVAGLVQALADYPLSCLEQATSRGFPLAMLPDGPIAGADRAGRLQQALGSVLDRQRFDGGFGLWSASRGGGALAVGLRHGVPAARPRRRRAGARAGDEGRAEVRRGRGGRAGRQAGRPRGAGVPALRAGARRPGAARGGARPGGADRSAADAAGEGAAWGGAGAGA